MIMLSPRTAEFGVASVCGSTDKMKQSITEVLVTRELEPVIDCDSSE